MSQRVKGTDLQVGGPVTLINAFSVPVEESERFIQRWNDSVRARARW